jgi:hypothetical protein
MGEQTQLNQGDTAPNDGVYVEVGVNAFHMGINDPKRVTLKKGDKLPKNTNHERKWVREGKH